MISEANVLSLDISVRAFRYIIFWYLMVAMYAEFIDNGLWQPYEEDDVQDWIEMFESYRERDSVPLSEARDTLPDWLVADAYEKTWSELQVDYSNALEDRLQDTYETLSQQNGFEEIPASVSGAFSEAGYRRVVDSDVSSADEAMEKAENILNGVKREGAISASIWLAGNGGIWGGVGLGVMGSNASEPVFAAGIIGAGGGAVGLPHTFYRAGKVVGYSELAAEQEVDELAQEYTDVSVV